MTDHDGIKEHIIAYELNLQGTRYVGTGRGRKSLEADADAAEDLLHKIEGILDKIPRIVTLKTATGSHQELYGQNKFEEALMAFCSEVGLDEPQVVKVERHKRVYTGGPRGWGSSTKRKEFTYTARCAGLESTQTRVNPSAARDAACCFLFEKLVAKYGNKGDKS